MAEKGPWDDFSPSATKTEESGPWTEFGGTEQPKSIGDRLSHAWETATPGGPLWMAREAVRGMRGAVEGSKAAVQPQTGTEEEEFLRRQAEEAGPGQAMRAAQFMTPGAPGGGALAVPKVPAIPEAVPQTAVSASERLGVPISKAAVSESPTIQSSAAALKEVPFVGTPLVKSSQRTLEGLDKAARETAEAYGNADTVTGGEAASRGIENWITGGSGKTAGRMYDRVDDMVDPEFNRQLHAARDAAQRIMARRANANIEGPSAAVREVENAVTNPNGLNYQGIKDLRTYFRDLTPQQMITKGIEPQEARQIYGALTEDLRGTILDAGGPEALRSFDQANRVYGIIADRRAALAKIIGKDADAAPERVMDRIMVLAGSKGNADANKLIQARRAIGAKDWDEVTSAVVNRMGRSSPEAEFSGDRFVTAWDNMSETGKRVLFNSTGKPELAKNVEDIMTLSRSFKQLKALGNPSGTGRVNAIMSALGALGGAIAGTVTIGLAAPLTMLGSMLGGRTVAYALSRPVMAKQVKEWSQAYVNAVRLGSPQAVARLASLSDRLAMSLRSQPLTGPVPSAAQPENSQRSRGGRETPNQNAGGKSHGGPVRRADGGPVRRALQSLKDYADGGAPEDSFPFDWSGVGAAMPEYIGREKIREPIISGVQSLATLPQRAFESSESMRKGGEYDPGPIVESAMLPMGTGAIAGVPVKGAETVLGSGAVRRSPVAETGPVWRSAVEDAIETLPMKSAPADQWANTLRNAKGIKPEEMDWLGLQDFFAAKKAAGEKVTKQELMDHVAGNKIELKDVMRTGKLSQAEEEWLDTAANRRLAPEEEERFRKLAARADAQETKYHSYQLPGGENYREHLLTMPSKSMDPEAFAKQFYDTWVRKGGDPEWEALSKAKQEDWMRIAGDQGLKGQKESEIFRSSHWDEPNVLAHVRSNDRVMETPEGPKKTLHLEEIQSDWHQKGRKLGYREGEPKTTPKLDANDLRIEQDQHQYIGHAPDGRITRVGKGTVGSEEEAREYIARYMNKNAAEKNMEIAQAHNAKVPAAPFKDTDAWAGLAMKRMIREATEKGYDRVSWTPGEAQAARYDLSKQISKIHLDDNSSGGIGRPRMEGEFEHGHLTAYDHNGRPVVEKYINDPKELPDIIGKEAAEKLLNTQTKEARSAGMGMRRRALEGVDLKIGGEGMREFYDKMLPKIAEKIGKAHGVKVHKGSIATGDVGGKYDLVQRGGGWRVIDTTTPNSEYVGPVFRSGGDAEKWLKEHGHTNAPVWYFDITPKLKEQALKGMSMFQRGGRVKLGKPSDRSVALKLAYRTKGERNGSRHQSSEG